MKANWIGIIVSAIVGLIVYIGYLWKTNENFREAVKNIWKNIQEFISAADIVVKAWDSTMEFSVTCGMAQKRLFECWHMDERSTWKCSRLG